jgi:hypothetical protein
MILRPTLALLLRITGFLSIALTAWGTALTTTVAPGEKLCFYADVDKAGEKIGVGPFRILYMRHRVDTAALQ